MFATPEFKTFLDKADIKTCYVHLMSLLEQNRKQTEQKKESIKSFSKKVDFFDEKTIDKFEDPAVEKVGSVLKKLFMRNHQRFFPLVPCPCIQKVFAKKLSSWIKTSVTNSLINSKNSDGDLLIKISREKKQEESIAKKLEDIGKNDETSWLYDYQDLHGQVASLCTARVIDFAKLYKEDIVKAVRRKGEEGKQLTGKKICPCIQIALERSVDSLIEICNDYKEENQNFFHKLATDTFREKKEQQKKRNNSEIYKRTMLNFWEDE